MMSTTYLVKPDTFIDFTFIHSLLNAEGSYPSPDSAFRNPIGFVSRRSEDQFRVIEIIWDWENLPKVSKPRSVHVDNSDKRCATND